MNAALIVRRNYAAAAAVLAGGSAGGIGKRAKSKNRREYWLSAVHSDFLSRYLLLWIPAGEIEHESEWDQDLLWEQCERNYLGDRNGLEPRTPA